MEGNKVIVDKETKEIVGLVFKHCGGCGRLLGQEYKGNCPDCGKELSEVGIIDEQRDDNHIFIGR